MNKGKRWEQVFFLLLLIIVNLVMSFGIVVPALVSASSNLAVVTGIAVMVMSLFFTIQLLISLYKTLKEGTTK